MRAGFAFWVGASVPVARAAEGEARVPESSNTLSLAELRNMVFQHGRTLQTFRIEGTVCAVVPGRNLLALEDGSAAVLLEVPILDPAIQAGDEVVVTGTHCAVTRSAFGVQLGTAPVVSNDGHHAAVVKSGNVFLEAGLQPIRVNWFNGVGLSALQVEYEGPGISRQTIPTTALWRKPGELNGSGPQPGIDFAAFTGNWRFISPRFPLDSPVARGVATNFDLRYSVRPEGAALEFMGYINIPTTGAYTFYVKSDDGGYLYAGNPAGNCCVSPLAHNTAPAPSRFEEALAARDHYPWTQIEGDVVYAAHHDDQLELEVASKKGERIQVAVVEGSPLFTKNLLHVRLRATGVLEALPGAEHREQTRLIVPGCGQIDIQNVPEEQAPPIEESAEQLITTAERVRHLTRTVAAQALPAKIRGVVVWKSHEAVVLEDETGGVYIHYSALNWDEEPAIGDLWEMEGPTDPGDFSPVIMARRAKFLGRTAMPEPIRPTWDQLINGSLDAEYVELRGALTTVSPSELDLLMSEGKLRIHYADDRPLPILPPFGPDDRSYVDSIVRIRGCLMAIWDANGQVTAGHVLVSPGTVEVEELAPVNPFAVPTRKTSNLLLFDPSASALQRTKVRGQILFGHGDDYRLQDEKSGLRLLTKEPVQLEPGDVVEAVGFPQLGGPSLVLQEARVRTIERAALPAPVRLVPGEFVNRVHDSTLVQAEAVLLEDRLTREGRVLELLAGQNHFSAHLRAVAPQAKPLEPGSRLLATGVYVSGSDEQGGAGSNGFALWLNSPAEIQMLQRPPWWTLRRAAIIVGILSGVLGIALVWITVLRRQVEERSAQLQKQIEERQIIEQRRAMEHERARIAKDIHDDLGASLTRITMLSLSAREELGQSAGPAAKLERVHATARELTRTMAEIVWAVNPRHDTLDSLASYLGKFAQDFLGGADVRCRLQMPLELPAWPLTAEVRHTLFLAFKESLHNILKHAGATEVRVSLETEASNLVLSVRDDGCGFAPPQTESNGADGSGNGLRNMRQRLEEIGGDCEIRSTPDNGCGTEVIFRVPVKGARR